jgi:hypothetical protein
MAQKLSAPVTVPVIVHYTFDCPLHGPMAGVPTHWRPTHRHAVQAREGALDVSPRPHFVFAIALSHHCITLLPARVAEAYGSATQPHPVAPHPSSPCENI